MKYSPAESSLPMMAMPLGISGSSISECMIRKAPPSSHSKEVRPWNVVPGTRGCVPTVLHLPINALNGLSAGLGIDASFEPVATALASSGWLPAALLLQRADQIEARPRAAQPQSAHELGPGRS